jgi:large subunit ribosomal protein L15
MYNLNDLKNSTKRRKTRRRVGRGIGSGVGKTCGRGEKGAGARSGYKRRLGYEGGQFRLFMKLPIRGFSNANFRKELNCINLDQIEKIFEDGETVNEMTLRERGFFNGKTQGLKVLGNGELSKKVIIEADAISTGARDKLQKAKIDFSIRGQGNESA